MKTETLILIIVIWIALGIHSAWFLVRRMTLQHDFYAKPIPMLVICVALPIITHIATLITYPSGESMVLFKKRIKK